MLFVRAQWFEADFYWICSGFEPRHSRHYFIFILCAFSSHPELRADFMSDTHSPVPSESTPPAPDYKDRSGGMVIFGVFTIILGVLSGSMAPLMLLGQVVNAHNPNAPASSLAMLLPALLIYAGLAVVLIWLGIGSIKSRRWARALLLIFAWSWLIIGVIGVAFMVVFIPKVLANASDTMPAGQQPLPHAAVVAVTVVTCVIMSVMFILIPAVWIFFYGSRHVKATCEAHDPVPRWTDACPLPVLAISLWLWFAVPMSLLMPVTYHGVAPFFGVFISWVAGGLFYLVLTVVWAWAGWRFYHRDARAWWVVLFAIILFSISNVLTYAHQDVWEMYRLMGYPEVQIEQMQKSGFISGNNMAWVTGCSMLPFLGYLLFVKKYLRGGSQALVK
jgi:hypothetical protein